MSQFGMEIWGQAWKTDCSLLVFVLFFCGLVFLDVNRYLAPSYVVWDKSKAFLRGICVKKIKINHNPENQTVG